MNIFQSLDNKQECVGLYYNKQLFFDNVSILDNNKTYYTWDYSQWLENNDNILYAKLLSNGLSLKEVCPNKYQNNFDYVMKRMNAFRNSLIEAKVSLNSVCLFDLIPLKMLSEYCQMKNDLTEYVIENYDKPLNYDYLLDTKKIITDIKYKPLLFEYPKYGNDEIKQFYNKVSNLTYIDYNMFKDKTGRLSEKPNSFPILRFPKKYRSILIPSNDRFIELDFNSAEARVALSLLGNEQPKKDIHEYNSELLSCNRLEAKKYLFAWLYNPNSNNEVFEKIYNKQKILDLFYKDGIIRNIYGRILMSDDYHSLNYIIRSTTADVFLEQSKKLYDLLKGKKTFIKALRHDSVLLDFSDDDKKYFKEMVNIYGNTRLGTFKINVFIGENYYDMREIKV